jgi:hypothetical protein
MPGVEIFENRKASSRFSVPSSQFGVHPCAETRVVAKVEKVE